MFYFYLFLFFVFNSFYSKMKRVNIYITYIYIYIHNIISRVCVAFIAIKQQEMQDQRNCESTMFSKYALHMELPTINTFKRVNMSVHACVFVCVRIVMWMCSKRAWCMRLTSGISGVQASQDRNKQTVSPHHGRTHVHMLYIQCTMRFVVYVHEWRAIITYLCVCMCT